MQVASKVSGHELNLGVHTDAKSGVYLGLDSDLAAAGSRE